MNSASLLKSTLKRVTLWLAVGLWCLWLAIPPMTAAQSDDKAIVRAVLFYSPSCPHCHYVISEVLSPLAETYGDQLSLIGVDTSQPGGAQLYDAAIARYQIPAERRGVPTLVVAETVLVGSVEIPDQFPQLVELGLASGGFEWPDIPGLTSILPEEEASRPISSPPPLPAATSSPPISDPVGFSLAGLVLVSLVMALGYTVWRLARGQAAGTWARHWLVPALALLGLVVAGYLAYVEVNQVQAVCGPVGECNLVQASSYARLFGIPVAVLGVVSYLTLIGLWLGQIYGAGLAHLALPGLIGLTLLGTVFSIYLTLLELVVIQAVCLWCLSSAVITAALMVLIVAPGGRGLGRVPYRRAFGIRRG